MRIFAYLNWKTFKDDEQKKPGDWSSQCLHDVLQSILTWSRWSCWPGRGFLQASAHWRTDSGCCRPYPVTMATPQPRASACWGNDLGWEKIPTLLSCNKTGFYKKSKWIQHWSVIHWKEPCVRTLDLLDIRLYARDGWKSSSTYTGLCRQDDWWISPTPEWKTGTEAILARLPTATVRGKKERERATFLIFASSLQYHVVPSKMAWSAVKLLQF